MLETEIKFFSRAGREGNEKPAGSRRVQRHVQEYNEDMGACLACAACQTCVSVASICCSCLGW